MNGRDLIEEKEMTSINDMKNTTTDSRMVCRRPDGTIYAVLSPARWAELRRKKQLDDFLERERDSGVVLELDDEPEADTAPFLHGRPAFAWMAAMSVAALLIAPVADACLAFFEYESEPQGLTKVCYYDHLGSVVAVNKKAYERCPLTVHVRH